MQLEHLPDNALKHLLETAQHKLRILPGMSPCFQAAQRDYVALQTEAAVRNVLHGKPLPWR